MRDQPASQWVIVGDAGDRSGVGCVADVCDVDGGCILGDVVDVCAVWYL
jgi:hypothetical protein